jgi:hypothetical protein
MLDPGGRENQKRSVLYNLLQLCTHGLHSAVHSMPAWLTTSTLSLSSTSDMVFSHQKFRMSISNQSSTSDMDFSNPETQNIDLMPEILTFS